MKIESNEQVNKLLRKARIEALKAMCCPSATRRREHKREAARCFELAARIARMDGPVIEYRATANACQR